MRQAVAGAFTDFSIQFEGRVSTMYLDVKGLVTIGIGNLIDPLSVALAVPFVHSDGRPATHDEITAEWFTIKGAPRLAQEGWRAAAKLCTLRLSDAGLRSLVLGKLGANEAVIQRRFPQFDEWPADAQLAIHSLAWAVGPSFHFPKLEAALRADPSDFAAAAVECKMNEAGNPGLIPRNVANRQLFENAAQVVARDACRETLYYPESAGDVLDREG